jgi:hypothetical protein
MLLGWWWDWWCVLRGVTCHIDPHTAFGIATVPNLKVSCGGDVTDGTILVPLSDSVI